MRASETILRLPPPPYPNTYAPTPHTTNINNKPPEAKFTRVAEEGEEDKQEGRGFRGKEEVVSARDGREVYN